MWRAMGVALLTALTVSPVSADLTNAAARKTAPDFKVQDANGNAVSLSALKGKVVLLDFWATWCAPCKLEIPWFMEFQTDYGSKGLAAVGVALDDGGWERLSPTSKNIRSTIRSSQATHPWRSGMASSDCQ